MRTRGNVETEIAIDGALKDDISLALSVGKVAWGFVVGSGR